MAPLELAHRYLSIVYKGGNMTGLTEILAEDLVFKGPLFEFDSANAYIDSMLEAPPKEFSYEIIQEYQNQNSACVVYQFSKPGISTLMSQVFEVANDKITRIFLVFDVSPFR